MANPTVFGLLSGNYGARATLLSAVTATDDGTWYEAESLGKKSIHVSGITSATVQIRGSNAAAIPLDTAHEIQLGADITTDGMVEVTTPVRFIKAMVSAYTTGTINARMLGHGG